MIPDISEFSFGFALTRELTNYAGAALHAAPVFPTLFAEGQIGGGYDVHLDLPGLPLFLQFKRADCMKKGNAKQIQDGLALTLPFYRCSIMNREPNDQHELLLNLDADPNCVFYASPRFHLVEELNLAYLANSVAASSFFIRPRDIGALSYEQHCMAYDRYRHFVCSEPREVPAHDGTGIGRLFVERLSQERRSLQQGIIQEALQKLELALQRSEISPKEIDLPESKLSYGERAIQRIADLSIRYFGAQFFLVQKMVPTSEA
jgi:hypothetical protein